MTKIIHFNDTQAPHFLGHETPNDTNRRHVKERLGLSDADIESQIVWCDDFGGGKFHFEFLATDAAAARIEKEQPKSTVRVAALGAEPSFRWSSGPAGGGFDDDDFGDFGFAKPAGKDGQGPKF